MSEVTFGTCRDYEWYSMEDGSVHLEETGPVFLSTQLSFASYDEAKRFLFDAALALRRLRSMMDEEDE